MVLCADIWCSVSYSGIGRALLRGRRSVCNKEPRVRMAKRTGGEADLLLLEGRYEPST